LWKGRVEHTLALLAQLTKKSTQNFANYVKKHSSRLVNYQDCSSFGLCSIGSGAVESAVKQIGTRLKISGAQWKEKNIPQMLQLRCAYLNGQLTA
jgi:hypothetical protein